MQYSSFERGKQGLAKFGSTHTQQKQCMRKSQR